MNNTIILTAFLLLVNPFQCIATETQLHQNDTLTLEVLRMTKSLDKLIDMLESQQKNNDEYQRLQAAISYLSFRSRNIEMMQYDLRLKKERRDSIEAQIAKIEDDPDTWDKIDKTFQPNQSGITPGGKRPSELRIEFHKSSLRKFNAEISSLEAEIQNSKYELESFESYVQSKLNLIK